MLVGIFPALKDHGHLVGHSRRLLAEEGDDGLALVVRHVGLVEGVKHGLLIVCGDVNVAQVRLGQEAFQDGFVTLHELCHQRFRVLVGIVFGLQEILVVTDESLHIQRVATRIIIQAQHLHRFSHQHLIRKQCSMPGERGRALQLEVVDGIAIGIRLILAAAADQLLSCFQEIQHCGFVVELRIVREGLHGHAHGMEQALVGATVVDRFEQCLLLIAVFR